MKISEVWEWYSSIMQNTFKPNEWPRIWVLKTIKIELQKGGGRNNSAELHNWFPQKIMLPLFNLWEFWMGILKVFESTPESCRQLWNLRNDEELESLKILKLKYRRGNQIIQPFCRLVSQKGIRSPSLVCGYFQILRKVLFNHAENFEI